ncbi:MAG: 16S rRNA (cytosine(1402)-N(4))-methyltransferase RsmH [Francisellaceae bacterium]|nr:16S rRNA (cytosine(1402)-N(4))-methyltransferase RsmH [Francisellaceae bacterium]MBT6539223.1 16S rRNA (cytosine(1402)-N(4))-methyltransferase RsmH [Francisellaceae bacterium]
MIDELHKTVLLEEAITALAIKADGIYIDATFGRGGHSRAILSALGPNGSLYIIDKDPQAIASGEELQAADPRVKVFHGSYSQIKELCVDADIVGKVDGVLADLGVSSPQLDEASRGFSFSNDGPLDMRMDTTTGLTAEQWLNETEEEEIANTIYGYGDERFSRRIARAIVRVLAEKKISSTLHLAQIVSSAIPKKEKHKHPATRTFQAIRIKINNELSDLEKLLPEAIDVLSVGGRLAIISFHSLEDKIVKRFFAKLATGDDYPKDIPIPQSMIKPIVKKIGKPVRSSENEVSANVRSRSAIMRVVETLEGHHD